jgi:hypothetical protein
VREEEEEDVVLHEEKAVGDQVLWKDEREEEGK